MKKLFVYILSIFLLTAPLVSISQSNELIIGLESDSVYINDFEDVVLNTNNGNWEHYIDIDNNNEWDLRFTLEEYSGGESGGAWTKLYTNDGTLFTVDTMATQRIGPYPNYYLDTTSQVKIYSIGDTLRTNEYFLDFSFFTNVYVWFEYQTYYSNRLINWVGGIHYVGIKKTIENQSYLGWVKVEIPDYTEIIIKEFAINKYLDTLPHLIINEFMALNTETITDEYGQYDDWIELYNTGPDSAFLGDLYLTDDFLVPLKWKLPDVYLQPYEFQLIWADGKPWQGSYHTNFKLDDDGEMIGIFKNISEAEVDAYTFSEQSADISEGRFPNGTDNWLRFTTPTPGASNEATSVNENISSDAFRAFPNPISNDIVYFNKEVNYKLYNSNGQLLLEKWKIKSIDLRNYPNGLYLIITDDGEQIKLIKQ